MSTASQVEPAARVDPVAADRGSALVWALRDTSAVFALLIAVIWLKEPFTKTRVAAVLLAAAAVPLLRLG